MNIGGLEMPENIDYRSIADEVRKSLPGEEISRQMYGEVAFTTTRSTGSERYGINGETWFVERPTLEAVAAMVGGLFAPGNYFAVLSQSSAVDPSEYVDNCAYVQVAVLGEDDTDGDEVEYQVESQFLYGWDKDKDAGDQDFTQKQFRRRTRDVGEVKEIFEAFVSGTVPDTSSWTDVTEEIHLSHK
jgi:hypothetical protein